MALCTSCGHEVAEFASFCTTCGQRLATDARPDFAANAAGSVCSSCGAPLDASSAFCTSCGQRRSSSQPAPPVETASAAPSVAVAAAAPVAASVPAMSSAAPVCTSCGTRLEPETRFCTACGQPAPGSAQSSKAATGVAAMPQIAWSETSEATQQERTVPVPAAAPAAGPNEIAPTSPIQPAAAPVPQVASPSYPAPNQYQPALQASGGKFGVVVLVLLLVIVVAACGGWYFWGVETVVVCSPPEVTLFLDDKELVPTSFGRYVIPHLSRQTHFLKAQSPGFADTIQRLDFPLTSLHEWVIIRLVPSRQK